MPFTSNTPKLKVWLPLDKRLLGDPDDSALPFLVVAEKYADAVHYGMDGQTVLYPLAGVDDIPSLLQEVDGVLLTGSPANIHPNHFGEEVSDPSLPLDPERDTLTLPLVQACIKNGVPILGICRGFQEINVALGGSLHQQVQNQTGMLDHRERPGSIAHQYQTVHPVQFVQDSIFMDWAGGASVQVNSLHGQGVRRLAPGLKVHAYAPDGLVEAFEIEDAKAFAYAVQWHPEWRSFENPFYSAIFHAFGLACQSRQRYRLHLP